jgi:type I restriction enzyme S subunit
MDAQRFLAEFGHIANAPNGIAKLRELVLAFAMQGAIAPQVRGESVAALLEQIEMEKQQLTATGALRTKQLPPIGDKEQTHLLPVTWSWVRFGDIAIHNSGKTLDSVRNSGLPRDYITTSNLYWGRFDLLDVRQMLIRDEELERCTARKNDLLICEGGEAGRAAVWSEGTEICFQNHIHRARFFGGINPYFVYRFFEKLNATGELNAHRKGIGISNLSSKALAMIPVPLPPLEEQSRIVAKVDALMALCDALERQQQDRRKLQNALRQSALQALASAPSPRERKTAWTRLADNFVHLFSVPEDIRELRQLILQLAIRGLLIDQCESDDKNIEKFLFAVKEKREKFISDRVIRRLTLLPRVEQHEEPFALPQGWQFRRLGEISICRDSQRIPLSKAEREPRRGPFPYYGASGIIDHVDDYIFEGNLLLVGEDGANLINRSTPIAFMATGNYWVNNHAHVLDSLDLNALNYLNIFINAIDLKPYVTGTAQPKINQERLNLIVVAVPIPFHTTPPSLTRQSLSAPNTR